MQNVATRVLDSVGRYLRLIWEVTVIILRSPPSWTLTRDQLFSVGVLSLPVVAITGFATGLILAVQAIFQLSDKGLASATGLMVGKSMVTELGPVLTAFMVTGRVGAAMCAELGTMRVSEQIDALRSMAVNPMRYLVAPRCIAGVVMMPPLTLFSALMGVVGGLLICVYIFNMAAQTYLDPIPLYVDSYDFVIGMVKAVVFGVIITTICCYKGLETRGGAAGVGRMTTSSVVICYATILIANFLLTILLENIHTSIYG